MRYSLCKKRQKTTWCTCSRTPTFVLFTRRESRFSRKIYISLVGSVAWLRDLRDSLYAPLQKAGRDFLILLESSAWQSSPCYSSLCAFQFCVSHREAGHWCQPRLGDTSLATSSSSPYRPLSPLIDLFILFLKPLGRFAKFFFPFDGYPCN